MSMTNEQREAESNAARNQPSYHALRQHSLWPDLPPLGPIRFRRPTFGAVEDTFSPLSSSEAENPILAAEERHVTLQFLEAIDDQRRNTIGSYFYNYIRPRHPNLPGKISGMLLELPNSEQLELVRSPAMLDAKIEEAMRVLREAGVHSDAGSTQDIDAEDHR
jgi:hypothetical protein